MALRSPLLCLGFPLSLSFSSKSQREEPEIPAQSGVKAWPPAAGTQPTGPNEIMTPCLQFCPSAPCTPSWITQQRQLLNPLAT